jgi:signal transduction histidine kinase
MKVKDRLSLQFTFMFAVLLFVVLTGIYLFVEHNRVKSFFSKLDDRAITVAQFYLAEDNLSKENFNNVIRKFPLFLSNEVIRIYDEQFHPVFIPEDTVRWNADFLKKVIAQKQLHLTQNKRQITGIYYADNSGNFIIVVSAIDDNGYRDMHELGLIMSFFFLFSLAVTFLLGRIFARIALFPIIKITNNLKVIRSSSLDQRLPIHKGNTDEIDILSITINQLLEHLEQSFEGQQSFIAHASHELRTPITSILGEAEITLMNDRTRDEYKSTLKNIISETERLHYIINSLMELMQTSMKNVDFQSIRMDELLWEIVDELSAKNREVVIKVNYNLPTDRSKFTILGNRQLLFIAVSNILKNALKFSDKKDVYCEIYCGQNDVNLIIRDKGIGIDEKDLNKLFQPFFRSSNALGYPGYGIGLSLTQNVVRLHNGQIAIKSVLGKGTEFQITFPNYLQ